MYSFFFKQKTAYEVRISDWSSDVCSSDLQRVGGLQRHDAAQSFRSPERRLRPAHHFKAAEAVIGQQLESRLIARRRIIEADAVDEQKRVVGLRAPDAELALRAARSSGRDRHARREPQHVARRGEGERVQGLLIEDRGG